MILQIDLKQIERNQLWDIPGLGRCAVNNCSNDAWTHTVHVVDGGADVSVWDGTRGYLCSDHNTYFHNQKEVIMIVAYQVSYIDPKTKERIVWPPCLWAAQLITRISACTKSKVSPTFDKVEIDSIDDQDVVLPIEGTRLIEMTVYDLAFEDGRFVGKVNCGSMPPMVVAEEEPGAGWRPVPKESVLDFPAEWAQEYDPSDLESIAC